MATALANLESALASQCAGPPTPAARPGPGPAPVRRGGPPDARTGPGRLVLAERAPDPAAPANFELRLPLLNKTYLTMLGIMPEVPATLTVGAHDLRLYAVSADRTLCFEVLVARQAFTTFQVTQPVVLQLLARPLNRALNVMSTHRGATECVFRNEGDTGLALAATGARRAARVSLAAVDPEGEDTEVIDTSTFVYPLSVRLDADEFRQNLRHMPQEFSLSVRGDELVFLGRDVTSQIELTQHLGDAKAPALSYRQRFHTASFSKVINGTKFAKHLDLSLTNDAPLRLVFPFSDRNQAGDASSYVMFHVCGQYDDEDEGEGAGSEDEGSDNMATSEWQP